MTPAPSAALASPAHKELRAAAQGGSLAGDGIGKAWDLQLSRRHLTLYPPQELPEQAIATPTGNEAKCQKPSQVSDSEVPQTHINGQHNEQHRDSACVLTPLSFPNKAGPAPPASNPLRHIQEKPASATKPVALDGALQLAKSPSLARPVARPVAENGAAEYTIQATSRAAEAHQEFSSQAPPTIVSSGPRNSINLAYCDVSELKGKQPPPVTLAENPFKWPPRNLERENIEYQQNLKPLRLGNCAEGFDVNFVERLVDSHAEYWKPFHRRVNEEKKVIASLKEAAFKKLALKQEIERSVIRLRMNLRRRRSLGLSTQGGTQSIQIFDDTQAKLDREIAALHVEWKSRVVNLSKLIENAYWPEYHRTDFEMAQRIQKAKEDAEKEEFTRLMSMMGWEDIPFPEDPDPTEAKPAITVPEWFAAVEASGVVDFQTQTAEDRYEELVNTIACMRQVMDQKDPRPLPNPFVKQFHEPHPLWPHPKWRTTGGWWTCRTGPGASLPEENCTLCDPKRSGSSPFQKPPPASVVAKEHYDKIMAEIEKASRPAMERDKQAVRAALAIERRENEQRFGDGSDEGYNSR
ncbi:hypothetical protein QBC47DRAFT_401906 [Echria macrotheca]|uniref:Uncharacterized protein n=1 Tax=Echria macrotheca TaxID=438768 RepID=A0AAJ0F6J4_9PEZI|nr:hypothetical protein QBC47DRAFT_401906 [Echria macrotheca]